MKTDRRAFLQATALGAAPLLVARPTRADDKKKDAPEEEISAPEDLMREHGVLNRILLIYEEGIRRLKIKHEIPPEAFAKPANLVRKFIEDYHEKLEEKFIFPEFEKRQKLTGLVRTLRQQHAAGRKLTDVILRDAAPKRFGTIEGQTELIRTCEAFIRMYRPHEAREDTVLFPALYKIVPAKQVRDLGERFEQEEHRLFGDDGFEKAVAEVAAIEKQLGIHDLARFTPK
jgi:hemerythrin-like domain-containing protein